MTWRNGCAHGFGSAAIDIGKLVGAKVICSADSTRKLEVLRGLAPDLVLDHSRPDIVERVRKFTDGEGASVVFEHIGHATWQRSLELAAPSAWIVSAGATAGDDVHMDVTYVLVK